MKNFAIILILAIIVGAVIFYLYRAKKSGQKCIGCPHSKTGNCQCGCDKKE